ncbi:hypothetical protein N7475_006497 [Penicillium sp. IBT 31633x]|nr:hypothetical protein N7475_006497 [Penicillium sp. IBT 31633x]
MIRPNDIPNIVANHNYIHTLMNQYHELETQNRKRAQEVETDDADVQAARDRGEIPRGKRRAH